MNYDRSVCATGCGTKMQRTVAQLKSGHTRWGNKLVEQVANDLREEFPEMQGLSRSNLFYAKKFYLFYGDTIVQQAVGQFQNTDNHIELKNARFQPEYTGKLNFYLSAVDSLVKMPDDSPTIGLLLCKEKNSIEAEFALRDIHKPIGVSEYVIAENLPEDLKSSLPTIDEIEKEFENE